jgi:murein DD-endopeptidase MepM/ murein hydrolase activator NlpD
MTTKLLLVVGVLQTLALSQTAQAEEAKCFNWPFDLRPVSISQRFSPKHPAIDIVLPQGTVLSGIATGKVVFAGQDLNGANVLEVQIGDLRFHFGHLSEIKVRLNDLVEYRDILGNSGGAVGAEGSGTHTTGSHLHLMVFNRQGQQIDPEPQFCR